MTPKTILIIEDEEDLIEIYQTYASRLFDRVVVASTCKEAKNILKMEVVDCILVDNRLPDGYGISVIKEIDTREANIPVVMITGYADKDLAIDSLNTGVTYFLEKPVNKQKITETLAKCIEIIEKTSEQKELELSFQLTNITINHLKETYNISEREIEVISYALHYYKNTLIAQKLFISPGTVKRHLHNIFEKMEISSKEELQELIQKLNSSLNN